MDNEKIALDQYNKGCKFLEEGNNTMARYSFAMALEEDEKSTKYYIAFGNIFLEDWANLSWSDKVDCIESIIEFIENFDKLHLDNNSAECFYLRGSGYKALADFEDNSSEKYKAPIDYQNALNDLSKAIDLDKSQEKYYKKRGIIYLELEKYNRALLDFNQAIQLNDADAHSYYLRGRLCEDMKNFDDAIKDYIYTLHLDNSHNSALFRLGFLCQNHLKDYEKAYELYIKVKDLTTDSDSLEIINDQIQQVVSLGNIQVQIEETEEYEEPEETLFGKIINVIKSGVSQISTEYNKKLEKIERNKERFKYKSSDELREIMMNSNIFEEKVAAKRLLEDKG